MLDYVSVRNWVSNPCTRVTAKLATFMLFTDPGETVVETKEHVSHQQTSHATCNHRDTHTLGRWVGYLNFLRAELTSPPPAPAPGCVEVAGAAAAAPDPPSPCGVDAPGASAAEPST